MFEYRRNFQRAGKSLGTARLFPRLEIRHLFASRVRSRGLFSRLDAISLPYVIYFVRVTLAATGIIAALLADGKLYSKKRLNYFRIALDVFTPPLLILKSPIGRAKKT
jgi:hypothetical protein